MPIVHEEDGLADCPICGDLKKDSPQWGLECGHSFCHACLRQLLQITPDAPCPICRREISGREAAAIFNHRETAPSALPDALAGPSSPFSLPSPALPLPQAFPGPRRPRSPPSPPPAPPSSPISPEASFQDLSWVALDRALRRTPNEVADDPAIQHQIRHATRTLGGLPRERQPDGWTLEEVYRTIFHGVPGYHLIGGEINLLVLPRPPHLVPPTIFPRAPQPYGSAATRDHTRAPLVRTVSPSRNHTRARRPSFPRAPSSPPERNDDDAELRRAIAQSQREAAEHEDAELQRMLAMSQREAAEQEDAELQRVLAMSRRERGL